MVAETQSFYTSLGLPPLPKSFWNVSMFSRPKGRSVVCHASAWDFTRGDVRLKMCLVPTLEDFYVTSHEMGHLYYFLAYKDQPYLFRDGAHDGFHEAIGDTMALSARPPWHLKQVGLAPQNATMTPEARLNFLMKTALEKVAFLPFGLLVDRWRWDVFVGKASFGPAFNASSAQWLPPAAALKPEQWNALWWAYRQRFQGVAPPVNRTAPGTFDAGAKFHVSNAVPYMRYFLSENLQFQFHKALCGYSGYVGPLSNCSIAGSREAGAALWGMLSLGASRPWPEALFNLTGACAGRSSRSRHPGGLWTSAPSDVCARPSARPQARGTCLRTRSGTTSARSLTGWPSRTRGRRGDGAALLLFVPAAAACGAPPLTVTPRAEARTVAPPRAWPAVLRLAGRGWRGDGALAAAVHASPAAGGWQPAAAAAAAAAAASATAAEGGGTRCAPFSLSAVLPPRA